MPFAMFEGASGVKFLHVPYSGGGPAMTALVGGQVDMTAGGPSVIAPQARSGKLRVLASWGSKRLGSLPDVPTFKELGMDMEYFIWSGVFVPAATPAPIQAALRDAIRRTVQDPEFKATMEKLQTPVAYLDAPDFARYWDADAKRLHGALKGLGCIEEQSK
jgi:tripartite-type tricarboxylate transporter receptor subunit TctC